LRNPQKGSTEKISGTRMSGLPINRSGRSYEKL